MAIAHAEPGEVVEIMGAGEGGVFETAAIFKSKQLEVIRMGVPKGKEIPPHRVAGEVTVQCLAGRVLFSARGKSRELRAGQMLHLLGGDEHALKALEDASVLVTIALAEPVA